MLDGRVLGASQVEYKPFGNPPLKRERQACQPTGGPLEQILGPLLSNWTVCLHAAGAASVDGYTLTLAVNPWNIVRTYNLTPGQGFSLPAVLAWHASNFVVHLSKADNVHNPTAALWVTRAPGARLRCTLQCFETELPQGIGLEAERTVLDLGIKGPLGSGAHRAGGGKIRLENFLLPGDGKIPS